MSDSAKDEGVRPKPCPFCGGDVHIYESDPGDMNEWSWVIDCKRCYAGMEYVPTKKEAIKAWNRRSNNETDKD